MAGKRKAADLRVPQHESDPAERKRVLNILAQRRYRQRKKERLETLESQVQVQKSWSDPEAAEAGHFLGECPADLNKILTPPSESDNLQGDISNMDDTYTFDPVVLDTGTEPWDPAPFFPTTPRGDALQRSSPASTLQPVYPSPSSSVGADDRAFPLLEYNLMRATFAIAQKLGTEQILFTLEANSLFNTNPATMDWSHLPTNLRPTMTQKVYPHHPLLDVLPWPAVRDRLIMTFAQPREFRPAVASSPTALVDFAYDLEDTAEGVRVWGDNPFDVDNWEVGQKLFSRWWWAMDREVISHSNRMRRQRGAKPLSDGTPRIQELL